MYHILVDQYPGAADLGRRQAAGANAFRDRLGADVEHVGGFLERQGARHLIFELRLSNLGAYNVQHFGQVPQFCSVAPVTGRAQVAQ